MTPTTRWLAAGVVVGCLFTAAGVTLRARRAVDRDAESVRAALADGRPIAAIEPLRRWLDARPTSAEAHALRAEVSIGEGDFPEVKRHFNEARALGYSEEKLKRIEAVWLAKLGRFAEAEPVLERIWKSQPRTDPAVDEALARIYLKTYRLRSAKAVIDRWIQDAPADGRPYLWLTEIDRRTEVDNPGSWEVHYREALKRDPSLDTARRGLAESLHKVHQNEEAAREYEDYLSRHPDDPVALTGAGLNTLELGDLPRAAVLLDRSLAVAPKDPAALKGRANVAIHEGDHQAARRWLDRAIEADPFDDGAFHTRAQVKSLLGDPAGAESDRASFDRLKREQAELLSFRTRLLDATGDNETRSKVVAWCFEHGRVQDGLDWANAILARDPSHPATCALLAKHYAKQPDGAGLANYYRMKAGSQASEVR